VPLKNYLFTHSHGKTWLNVEKQAGETNLKVAVAVAIVVVVSVVRVVS